jgi:hypothetical protein
MRTERVVGFWLVAWEDRDRKGWIRWWRRYWDSYGAC